MATFLRSLSVFFVRWWLDSAMLYKIRAKIIRHNLKEFYSKLTDGTINEQFPDGKEIIDSMKRAKIVNDGFVEWFETCYCSTPLKHERDTQYDNYFSDFTIKIAKEIVEIEGESFWDYIKRSYF